MILTEDDILEILQSPRNENIGDWQTQNATLDVYLNGGDVSAELKKVDDFENISQKKLRDKLARSTKDKLSNLLNPLSKIFNVSGGSITFDDISKAQKDKFQALIEKLPEGISFRDWMESYWKEAFVIDPNSILLIETDKEGVPYPTYKNISTVHDYRLDWDKFKYLVLFHKEIEINKEKVKVFRVYDEIQDALYYVDKETLHQYGNTEEVDTFDEDFSFVHNYGFVPAVVPGGEIDKKTTGKRPFINKIDEALTEYLRASSVFVIYKFLHLFPKFWRYAMKCVTCSGTGQVLDTTDSTKRVVCPTCNGQRLKITTDVSDAITLPIPKEGQPALGGNVAGYIDLPIEAWDQMNQDLKEQMQEMEFSLWGSYLTERDNTKERTATESYINIQPINDELCGVSRVAESKESQLLTFMSMIMFEGKGEIVSKYGKRFIIETPDTLWNKYIQAKKDYAPITTLDYHYEQYLMSEYQNDTTMLEMRKKIFSIEPFTHYSLVDLEVPEQKQKKLMFSQWVTSDIDFDKDAVSLSEEFDVYFEENKAKPEEPKTE